MLETKAGPAVWDRQILVRTSNFLHISLQIDVGISHNFDQERQLFQLSPEHCLHLLFYDDQLHVFYFQNFNNGNNHICSVNCQVSCVENIFITFMRISYTCMQEDDMVPPHWNSCITWLLHLFNSALDYFISRQYIPQFILTVPIVLCCGSKLAIFTNNHKVISHWGYHVPVGQCKVILLSGKLWYLQHKSVGDTIVYH